MLSFTFSKVSNATDSSLCLANTNSGPRTLCSTPTLHQYKINKDYIELYFIRAQK